jgi:hypothetical protein
MIQELVRNMRSRAIRERALRLCGLLEGLDRRIAEKGREAAGARYLSRALDIC